METQILTKKTNIFPSNQKPIPSMAKQMEWLSSFCEFMGIDMEQEIISKPALGYRKRKRNLFNTEKVRAVMYGLRFISGFSLTLQGIARLLSPEKPYDHATVFYHINKFEELLSANDKWVVAQHELMKEFMKLQSEF